MKIKEAAVGIFMIAIVIFIVIPINTMILDFLFMLSIFIGIIILLDALYAKEVLELSLFPTILLVTTLFRLVLNISSTRLILSKANAGKVVATFAEFVAGGNIVIGVIIFIIIVIVNFLVITKGSERVAEVTARFTLDAMPGKQMAIDADLNAGLIDEQQAKSRRQKVQDESNFYGAMDGASKFVKSDAIAGILITFINLAGGIATGVLGVTGSKLSFSEAVQIYSLMAIGDGLVGQIPALLISVATGLLVTKSTSESEISSTIYKQIFSYPLIIYIAGGVMIALGFTPLPFYFFVPFGLFLIYIASIIDKNDNKSKYKTQEDIISEEADLEEIKKPENIVALLNVDPILLIFGYGLIPLVDSSQGGDLLDRVVMIRRQIAIELGVIVPTIRLRDDIKLNPNQYKILIKGIEVSGGDILFDHYMAMNSGMVENEIEGIETVEPYMGLPALWITEEQREKAEAFGYTVVDPTAIIATHLTEVIRNNLHQLLTRQDVQNLINNIKQSHSVLIDELIPKLVNIGEIQKILGNLLKESISIRDLVTILETLADYAGSTRDIDILTEHVRQSLKRAISRKYFDNDINNVITLDPKLEQEIISSVQHTDQGNYLALDPTTSKKIFERLNIEIEKLSSLGQNPIVITSPIVRSYFKKLVEHFIPEIVVISYNELDSNIQIQSIGMVSI